jgi:WD40 repeat protein
MTLMHRVLVEQASGRQEAVRWRPAVAPAAIAAASSGNPSDLSRQPHIGPITALLRNPARSNVLLSAGSDGLVRLWNAASMQELLLLQPFDVGVASAAWAPARPSTFAVCLVTHFAISVKSRECS